MSRAVRSANDTTHQLPVFALPEYVLFPHTLVPFHVFEPRMCTMLDACLSDRRLVVVAGLQIGWEQGPEEEARVYDVAGLGRVISDRRLHDGRYNIFVHCIARVRIVRTLRTSPYREVDVNHVVDDGPQPSMAGYQRLVGLASGLVRALGPSGAALGKILGSTDDPAILTNRLATLVVDDPGALQHLLETTSPARRCELLEAHLARMLMERTEAVTAGSTWMN